MKVMGRIGKLTALVIAVLQFSACSVQQQLQKAANKNILEAGNLAGAHIGIHVFDPASNASLFSYQSNKYFVPASNTKIVTCFAALKYLGDSVAAAQVISTDSGMHVYASGDPTFLQPEYATHPLLNVLKNTKHIYLHTPSFTAKPFGQGWSWDDYDASYMPSRSAFPICGNVVRFEKKSGQLTVTPSFFKDSTKGINATINKGFGVTRQMASNQFLVQPTAGNNILEEIPYRTSNWTTNQLTLESTLLAEALGGGIKVTAVDPASDKNNVANATTIYSRPLDSLLKPLMHRSDNFYAEQALLMVGNKLHQSFDDKKTIAYLLANDLADLPQKPSWVDGSGLSRYNLFSPQDFTTILDKMYKAYSFERLQNIFPTGGEAGGTLSSNYKNLNGKIFAKTGTLSGQVALSGYLITKKGKTLIFSVLVNNHTTTASNVRKAVEQFIQVLYSKN
jgi:D-alanyl-D-alanine carboxypeptidase/D-alanyl-D-alanine-endopeptidase (penicillin-binding protein 4)